MFLNGGRKPENLLKSQGKDEEEQEELISLRGTSANMKVLTKTVSRHSREQARVSKEFNIRLVVHKVLIHRHEKNKPRRCRSHGLYYTVACT